MDEFLSINITIADRRYPMRIKRSEEEKIRKAAKIINERILQYQDRYSGKDVQDFLAMASLQFVLQTLETIEKSDVEPVLKQLENINNEINLYLSEK
ncbi:MAG: cell division protein ZapA [Prolixibacteraceae bacterium]|nr:cell division protein ZapA [Prolixibacteraceae bacterium]